MLAALRNNLLLRSRPPLSVNATAGNSVTATSATVTFSTSAPKLVIYLSVDCNQTPVVSVTSPNLTWIARTNINSGVQGIYTYYAIAMVPLTNEVITAVNTLSGFTVLDVIAIAGANILSPFDGSALTHTGGSSDPLSITTANPNTIILGSFKVPGASPTAGSGFTQYGAAASFHCSEYKLVTTQQSALSVGMTTGTGTASRTVVDAIKR